MRKYLDYLGYSKTLSTFEDELKSLGKQSNEIITPRNDSQKTEIQVLIKSQWRYIGQEWFSIEYHKTKSKPINYQLDYSADLETLVKPKPK